MDKEIAEQNEQEKEKEVSPKKKEAFRPRIRKEKNSFQSFYWTRGPSPNSILGKE